MGIEDMIVNEGVSKGSKWDMNAKGRYYPTYNNSRLFLEQSEFKIRWNEFSSQVELNGVRYRDNDALIIKESMRKMRLEVSVYIIDEAVRSLAIQNFYHPVKDYLSSLKWDGLSRTKTWLQELCGSDDTPYNSFIGRLILVSAIKRIYEPGCQYDTMVILEGDQGIGKSRLCRALGGDFYKSINLTDRDKDTIQMMQGGWILEVPELSVFAKRDIESLKAFISNPIDTARFAYGRSDNQYPRQSIFIGTINPETNGYLMDATGNRRFLPIKLHHIDVQKIQEMRDQLFAEAMHLYKEGFQVYILTDEMNKLAKQNQTAREYHDDWATLIVNYINAHRLDTSMELTCLDIWTRMLNGRIEQYDQRVSRRIGNILRKLGCPEPKHTSINCIQGKYFDLTNLVINDNKDSNSKNTDFTE